MAQINQENIDALTKELTDSNGRIRSEIQALEDQIAQGATANSLDFSGLKTAIDDAANLVPDTSGTGATGADPSAQG